MNFEYLGTHHHLPWIIKKKKVEVETAPNRSNFLQEKKLAFFVTNVQSTVKNSFFIFFKKLILDIHM